MKNSFGNEIVTTLIGESHGKYISAVVDGLPAGIKVDFDLIEKNLQKRRPKKNISTNRIENDEYEIISGVFNGFTNGCPICIIIKNQNIDDKVYDDVRGKMRPSHADLTQYIKYNGYDDYRGGGHFSGRLTAALVAVGSIAQMYLNKKNIHLGTHILKSQNIEDKKIENIEDIKILQNADFPMIDENKKNELIEKITKIKTEGDSIGALTETVIFNVEEGIGEPLFDNVESMISKALFGIPAIKGVSFGAGFDFCNMLGSSANDCPYYENGKIKYKTNNNGGINGGITNGDKIIINCAIKPTPSIYKEQNSIDFINKENIKLNIKGRHDPFIANRICPVIDAVVSLVLSDLYVIRNGNKEV